MILQNDEYKIQDDGIWISKKALEECKKYYCEVADKNKRNVAKFLYLIYLGKAAEYRDLLKYFEQQEVE